MFRYAQSVIKEGVLVAVRGKMIYVKTDDGFQEMVAGGTLMEGVFLALEDTSEEAKKSPHIQALRAANAIKDGAIELDAKTPEDVLRWIKAEFNDKHTGVGFSLIDQIDETEKIQAAWTAHRSKLDISKRDLPQKGPDSYYTQLTLFVGTHWPFGKWFRNIDHYQHTSLLRTKLLSVNLLEPVRTFLGEKCNMSDPRTNAKSVIDNLLILWNTIFSKKYRESHDIAILREIFMEALSFRSFC